MTFLKWFWVTWTFEGYFFDCPKFSFFPRLFESSMLFRLMSGLQNLQRVPTLGAAPPISLEAQFKKHLGSNLWRNSVTSEFWFIILSSSVLFVLFRALWLSSLALSFFSSKFLSPRICANLISSCIRSDRCNASSCWKTTEYWILVHKKNRKQKNFCHITYRAGY